MAYVKIRPRRGTSAQWENANPILSEGELGFEVPAEGVGTGLVNFKLGDNVTPWNDLPYAFKGAAVSESVENLAESAEEMNEDLEELKTAVKTLQDTVDGLRRVDVQSAEPATPSIGQVWIATDAVNGRIEFSEERVNIAVGDDPYTLTISNTLSLCDQVNFSLSFIGSSECAEITEQSNSNSNAYVKFQGKYAGTFSVVATAVYDGATVYRVTAEVNVAQPGSIELTATTDRLVVDKSVVVQAAVLDGLPLDADGITWSVSDASYLRLSERSQSSVKVTAIKQGGYSVNVIATAKYHGTTIYVARYAITTVGMQLSQNAVSLQAGNSTMITVYNSLVKGTDYDQIVYSVEDSSVATAMDTTDSSFTVVAGNKADTKAITLTAKLGNNDVQSIVCSVTVVGRLTLSTTSIEMSVNETKTVTVTNSLGTAADGVVWIPEPEDAPVCTILDSSNSGCTFRGSRAGNGWIRCIAVKDGVRLTSSTSGTTVATCALTVKGSIYFENAPTTLTNEEEVAIRVNCTLNSGTDYNSIEWSAAGCSISQDQGGLVAYIRPYQTGSTTIYARAKLGNNIVSTASLDVSVVAKKVDGSVSLSPIAPQIAVDGTVTFTLANTYADTDYDEVLWSISKYNGDTIAVVTTKSNSSATVRGITTGQATVSAVLLKGGVQVDDAAVATAALIVQGSIRFISDIQFGNVDDEIVLNTDNTLVPGTYSYYTWELSDTNRRFVKFTNASFDPTHDTTGATKLTLGPEAGAFTVTVRAFDSLNNEIAMAQTDTIQVLGAVGIVIPGSMKDDNGDIKDLVVGSTYEIAANNNLIETTQFTRYQWTTDDANDAAPILSITDANKTSCKITADRIGVVTLIYRAYNGANLVKEDSVRLVAQGAVTIDNVPNRTINIEDTLVMSANSTLVSPTGEAYTYEWISDTTSVAGVTAGVNPMQATVTGMSKGKAKIRLEAVMYDGGTRNVKYTSNEVELTILGGASIYTGGALATPLELGSEVEVVLTNDMDAGTYTDILWGTNDSTVVSIVTDQEDASRDYTKCTIKAVNSGTTTINAIVRDANGNALKTMVAAVTVNGRVTIITSDAQTVNMYHTIDIDGDSSLLEGTYAKYDWVSSNTNIFTVNYQQDPDNPEATLHAQIEPVALGTANLTLRALDDDGEVVYSSEDINITVIGGIQLEVPENMPSLFEQGQSTTVTLNNAYTSDDYDDIVWESSLEGEVVTDKVTITPSSTGATIVANDHAEDLVITVSLKKDGEVIDQETFSINIQGKLEIAEPAIGTDLLDTQADFDILASSSLIPWSYNAEGTNGGLAWTSSDEDVITVTMDEENYLLAHIKVIGTGTAKAILTAYDSDENVVTSTNIEFTISEETTVEP